MNFQELSQKIIDIGVAAVCHEDFNKNELPLKLVHEVGGHEGDGEYAERVFEHDNDGEKIYVKFTGFYSSYDGTDWDSDFAMVTPREKMITVYE